MNDKDLIAAIESNAHASAAVGVLLIHLVTLLARQPGFDRDAFVTGLQSIEMDPRSASAF